MPVLVLGSTGEPGKQDRVDTMLKMILVDGFFQADPHPGNVMWMPGNRIAPVDSGIVGRLSPARDLRRRQQPGGYRRIVVLLLLHGLSDAAVP
jgi:ABC1 atypical kinase-like domain